MTQCPADFPPHSHSSPEKEEEKNPVKLYVRSTKSRAARRPSPIVTAACKCTAPRCDSLLRPAAAHYYPNYARAAAETEKKKIKPPCAPASLRNFRSLYSHCSCIWRELPLLLAFCPPRIYIAGGRSSSRAHTVYTTWLPVFPEKPLSRLAGPQLGSATARPALFLPSSGSRLCMCLFNLQWLQRDCMWLGDFCGWSSRLVMAFFSLQCLRADRWMILRD